MDLSDHRSSEREQERIADLMDLVPTDAANALDIGTRDGFLASRLADRGAVVTALDLTLPKIDDSRILCVQGDVTRLGYADAAFDLVFCAEVLEHIPTPLLPRACSEIERVAARWILIGVPNRQDIRLGATQCQRCGGTNPPWGHVNSFDEGRLAQLFANSAPTQTRCVGMTNDRTNFFSAALMAYAGQPFGTYEQQEPCILCGQGLGRPLTRSPLQRLATRSAVILNRVQQSLFRPKGRWLHMLFERGTSRVS